MEALEEQIRKAKCFNDHEIAVSSAELGVLRKEHDNFKATAVASRERMYSQLVSSIDMLTLHKENIEHQLARLKKHCTVKMDVLPPQAHQNRAVAPKA